MANRWNEDDDMFNERGRGDDGEDGEERGEPGRGYATDEDDAQLELLEPARD